MDPAADALSLMQGSPPSPTPPPADPATLALDRLQQPRDDFASDAPPDPNASPQDDFSKFADYASSKARDLLEAGKSAFGKTPQGFQTAVKGVGTGIGALFNVAETPFRALKSGAVAAVNAGNELDENGNPQVGVLPAMVQGALGQRNDTFADILKPEYNRELTIPRIPGESDDAYQTRRSGLLNKITGGLGMVGEIAGDPLNWVSPFGLTKTGEEAMQAGVKATDLGQAAARGERALLTIGNTPVITGQPVMDALGRLQNTVRDFLPGFATKTTNPEFNAMLDKGLLNPISYSNILAENMMKQDAGTIDAAAEKMGIPGDDLRKQMAEYIEPSGSQLEGLSPDQRQVMVDRQDELAQQWPDEIKSLANQYVGRNRAFFQSESPLQDMGEREFYMKHNLTPEFRQHMQDTFGENQPALIPAARSKSTFNPSAAGRNLPDYTVNEINDLSQQGRLNEVYPDFPGLSSYKGKVFDDQVERVAAQRYLQNAKITKTADFLDSVGRTYGISEDAYRAGTRAGDFKESDYKWVPSPVFDGGGKYMPSEVSDFLNKAPQVLNPQLQKGLPQALKTISDYVKLYNFGLYPKSSAKVYMSNNILGFLSGHWDLQSQMDAARIAAKARAGTLSTVENIDMGPKLGAMSEKGIWDMAQQNRGVGMGLARAEMGYNTAKVPAFLGTGGPLAKTMLGAHNYAEDASRLGTYMNILKKGADPAGAASMTRDAIHDYSDLGEWDNKLKQMIPFYTFVRKNIPKMMELAATNPARMLLPEKIRQLVNQGHEQDESQLPEYAQDRMPFFVGKDSKGDNLWWYSGDLLPEQQLNQIIGNGKSLQEQALNTPKKALEMLAGLTNPAIKTPMELAENFALYTHKPIEKMPGEVQQVVPGVTVPSKVNYLLHQFRPVSEAGQASSEQVPAPLRALRSSLGFNVQAVNPEVSANYAVRAEKTDINQMRGLVSFYARQAAIHRMQGNPDQAKVDIENMHTAIQHLQGIGANR